MNIPTKIDLFKYEWAFLSNFYPCVIEMDGMRFASTEAAYQAAKTADLKQRQVFTLDFNPNLSAGQSKRMGRALKDIRPDWEDVKLGIMRDLLIQKFTPSILRRKLLATFTAELVEGNYWHDTWFGVCMGWWDGKVCRFGSHEPVGENRLGKLLMEVRSSLVSIPKIEDKTIQGETEAGIK